MNRLIAEKSHFLLKLAYIEGNELKRVEMEKTDQKVRRGQIYIGKITKRVTGLQAYFLDLGSYGQGFLQTKKEYRTGNYVLVQVKTEAVGEKQPKLTEEISLSGRYTVYLPSHKGVSISNKIQNDEKIREFAKKLQKDDPDLGLILRTDALQCDYPQIESDLLEQKSIFDRISNLPVKEGLVYEKSFVERFFSTFFEKKIDEVVSNDKELLKQIRAILEKRALTPHFRLTQERMFDTLGIDLQKLMQKRYPFGDLSIVMETTEAFTAVDINSGFQNRHLFIDDMSFQVNLQACKHIVDLVILKDISGVILIDFIDMKKEDYRNQLLETLRKEFMRDYKKVSVLNITSLGIVQVIRKREKQNIVEEFTVDCPHCSGSGRVMDSVMKMDLLERETERFFMHRFSGRGAVRIKVPKELQSQVEEVREIWEKKYHRTLVFHYGEENSKIEIIEEKG